ncbi:DUF7344 domain-containing protein [Halopelagius fulvigenes]|uniref:DUF7344 domain-containing protein n=1 Tax=Halopelagius fulvigenes TaxID=1198324 RepID=A0ABD5TZ41_9EURY
MTTELSDRDLSEFDAGGDHQDELFDVLSNPRRRFVLDNLLTVEMPVPVETLATELVEWEASLTDLDRRGGERDAVEISLVHNHLPKMADSEFVEYDAEDRTVTLGDRTDELRAHLRPTVPGGE